LLVPDLFFRSLFAFFNTLAEVTEGHPSECDPFTSRSLGGTTAAGGDSVWANTKIPDSGERPEIRFAFRTRGDHKWHQSPSNAVSNARRANAVCERFLGSVRREGVDHFLILLEKQLSGLLKADVVYFNQVRSHQGLGQRIRNPPVYAVPPLNHQNKVIAVSLPGGLPRDYRRGA